MAFHYLTWAFKIIVGVETWASSILDTYSATELCIQLQVNFYSENLRKESILRVFV